MKYLKALVLLVVAAATLQVGVTHSLDLITLAAGLLVAAWGVTNVLSKKKGKG